SGDMAGLRSFKVFADTFESGGIVKGLRVPGLATATRKELDDLQKFARDFGAKGLVTLALAPAGPKGPLVKVLSEMECRGLSHDWAEILAIYCSLWLTTLR